MTAGPPSLKLRRASRAGTIVAAAIVAWSLAAAPAAAQATHLLVVVGLAGDPDHADAFHRWAETFVGAAKSRYAVPEDHITWLAEQPDRAPELIDARSTGENIAGAIEAIAGRVGETDRVLVLLIGHGSADGRGARFNLPGPDLTAGDFAALVGKIDRGTVVFVNTASASGAFVEPLAGSGRAIVTATRSEAERYATLFGGFFADAFAGEDADVDKNQRVSLLEAFQYARSQVAAAYEREGLLLTEHAVLDDDGDGEGTGEPSATGSDGRLAAAFYLGASPAPAAASDADADPALQALYAERRALEQRVEGLRLLKSGMDPARYAAELEKVLVELATTSRKIRELEGKPR